MFKRLIILLVCFVGTWNIAAGQTVPPYPYLACDSFWAAFPINKVCNKPPVYLNFNAGGLSPAGYGWKILDTAATAGDTLRWGRSFVDKDSPRIGLSYRDEFKLRVIELGDTGVNLRFFNLIYHPVDYDYENLNAGFAQWKYGEFYPQDYLGIRPIGGKYKECVVIQTDTLNPGATSPAQVGIYPFADFTNNRDRQLLFEFNWGWTWRAWTKVYADGIQQRFNIGGTMMDSIPGPNMDIPYDTAHPSYPPFRGGQYQEAFNRPTPPVYKKRTVMYRRVIVGRTNMTASQFMPGVAPSPYLQVDDTTITAMPYTATGGPEKGVQGTILGNYLTPATGSITVTAPTGFHISRTSANVGFSGSVSLAYSGGSLPVVNVWYRLAPGLPAGSYTGSVSITGGSASRPVAISGVVLAAPVIPPVTGSSGGQAPVIFTNQ